MPEHTERLQRLDKELHERVTAWRLNPGVEALQALRGIQVTVAVTTTRELVGFMWAIAKVVPVTL